MQHPRDELQSLTAQLLVTGPLFGEEKEEAAAISGRQIQEQNQMEHECLK